MTHLRPLGFAQHLAVALLLSPLLNVWAAEATAEQPVDLTDNEVASAPDALGGEAEGDSHVLSNPWWMNLDIYGFGAAGFYDTGSDATRPRGGFEIKEASLFIEADVWDDASFFIELQTNRLGRDDQLFTRTGEVYVHFRELRLGRLAPIGLKLGRIDIPFGEEYLWQDAIDNPLITNSASYPYGWDEGLLLYADRDKFSWVIAVMDGTDARSREDNSDKAVAVKAYGKPMEALYLSASFMTNGDAATSALEFAGSHFQPIGASHASTLGASPSAQVGARLFEFDAKYQLLRSRPSGNAYLSVSLGSAKQNDVVGRFDRNLRWLTVQPYWGFANRWYAVLRFSEIGTYDDNEGFHFDGKTFAGGNAAFGYDTKRFRRVGLGLGWIPNPHVRAKLEIGEDSFDLIAASTLRNGGDREFIGFEIAVGF
jgi:hypothetical protein